MVTSWEEIVEGGKAQEKRSAFYDSGRLKAGRARVGPRDRGADLLNRFAMMRQLMMQIGMSERPAGQDSRFKQLAQMRSRARRESAGGI